MPKKEANKVPLAPAVNPELTAADKAYERDVRITESAPKLKRVLLLLWSGVDVVLMLIFVGYLGFYLAVAAFEDRGHIARIADNIDVQNGITFGRSAASLAVSDAQVFSLSDGAYDLYAVVDNPNKDWYATFQYYFEDDGETSETFHGFILPEEERPLLAFRQNFQSRPGGAELVIEDIQWRRVDHHEIDDLENWLADHQDFEVESADYAVNIEVGDERIGRAAISLSNHSPYAYWEADFLVLIVRAGTIAAVNTATVNGFESGETRSVNVHWFENIPTSGDVVVVPNINFFNEDVYMELQGEVGEDIRDLF